MLTILGRLTADAVVNQVGNGRQVVNFTVAQNGGFKPKGGAPAKEQVCFFECAYWLSQGVAPHLQKGKLVSVIGHLSLHTWLSKNGEARGSLRFQVQNIQLHGS